MPSTPLDAICEALASVSAPALVLDLGRALLLGANRTGATMWTGGAELAALPLPLDVAMPALAALRLALSQEGEQRHHLAQLTFWTTAGLQRWSAHIQAITSAPADIILVQIGSVRPTPAKASAGTLPSGPEFRHLVHELRTPLAAILSLAEILHDGHLGAIANERHRDYIGGMRDTARHALDVIEAMVVPRSELPELADPAAGLDISATVATVAAGMSALAARAGGRLSIVAGVDLPLVAADGTAVRQMLINLVGNSLAHAGGGVTVTIATGCETGREVWAEVTDNGPGIPLAVIEQLAADLPLDAALEGSGRPQLGLSLTRSLARANGGRLELATGPEGARVRLVFSAYQPPGGDQVVASSSG